MLPEAAEIGVGRKGVDAVLRLAVREGVGGREKG
jgi:hypothetical protein